MLADPDLFQSECLLVFLTGNLRASAVVAKRATEYKIMANFISKRKKKAGRREETNVGWK
jgi:hypothetical protein